MPRMTMRGVSIPLVFVCLGLAGCGTYDPPVVGDHAADKYKSDLAGCRTAAHHQVYLKNAATPARWVASPIIGPPEVRQAMRQCLRGKGYKLAPS